MKNSRSPYLIVAALVSSASLTAPAQTPPPEPAKTTAVAKPKAPEADKKAVAKKTTKPVAKKTQPPKTAAKAAPKKPLEIKTMGTDKPLTLRDKDGNIIPTTPDAYNVDSALPKKR